MPDAGNGIGAGGTPIANDQDDASVPDDAQSQRERIAQIVHEFGPARPDALRYYLMDNESSLWHTVHRDIHPVGAHASEIASKVIAYARAVKQADPGARVVAPEEWGWTGYFYSGFDQQYLKALREQGGAGRGYCTGPAKRNPGRRVQ